MIDQISCQYWATEFSVAIDMEIMEVDDTGQGSPPGNLVYEESKSHSVAWTLFHPLTIGTDFDIPKIYGHRKLLEPLYGPFATRYRGSNYALVNVLSGYPYNGWPNVLNNNSWTGRQKAFNSCWDYQ